MWSDIELVRLPPIRFYFFVHLGVLSIVILLHILDVLVWDSVFFDVIIGWVAINIIAFCIVGEKLTIPTEANVECPHCGSKKVTVLLRCENCKATSKLGEEKREITIEEIEE